MDTSSAKVPSVTRGVVVVLMAAAGSVLAACLGYREMAIVTGDAERSIVGFVRGYAAFAVSSAALTLLFHRAYRKHVGSFAWLAAGLLALPALVGAFVLMS